MKVGVALAVLLAACGGKKDAPPAPAPGSAEVLTALPSDAGPPDARRVDADLSPVPPLPTKAIAVRPLWSPNLNDQATFDAYSKEVSGERYAKLVIDLASDRIYYFDVNVYPVHADFVFAQIYGQPKTAAAVHEFQKNYAAAKPRFLLVSLSHHLAQDEWTFAFWAGDHATAAQVRQAYKRMAASFYLADKLKFRPDSPEQETVAKQTGDVPFVLNDQLYRQAEFQVFNPGRSVGTLVLVDADADLDTLALTTDAIVVLPKPVPDLPPVGGIVAETFGSPLAHTALRARSWGIPNVGVHDATKKFADLEGKPVVLEATAASYTLRLATPVELEGRHAPKAGAPVVLPVADLTATALAPLAQMTADDVHRYGAKAANLGVVAHAGLKGFTVPAGFGVPYGFYAAHLKAAGVDAMIAKLHGSKTTAPALTAIRTAITSRAIDPALCTSIAAALTTLGAGDDPAVFVRSSHNAEDLPHFSGAGLQDTIANVRGATAVCDAVKVVWASAWNPTAYAARELAGIDETTVAGAVLVQVGVAATAAGVMATSHPTDPTDDHTVTIDAKSGLGMAVVDGRQTPERLLVDTQGRTIRILSRSNEPTVLVFDEKGGIREEPNPALGKAVLAPPTALGLADAAEHIAKLLGVPRLDLEWATVDDQLYIVQARPLAGTP